MYSKHMAEPGGAASIYQRNPHPMHDMEIKPTTNRTQILDSFSPSIPSLSAVKQIQRREFANKAIIPSIHCAKTVPRSEFSDYPRESGQTPLHENWLYRTRPEKSPVKSNEPFKVSEATPDWFKQNSGPVTEPKDPTITVFSRLSGWIYVSSGSRNRQHRLDRRKISTDEKPNIQNVSSLAPVWMQREHAASVPPYNLKVLKPPPFVRKEQNRLILVDDRAIEKSVFSIGDFRHDVRTVDEVEAFNKTALGRPKQFLEWKEQPGKQSYDKPVALKVGARLENLN